MTDTSKNHELSEERKSEIDAAIAHARMDRRVADVERAAIDEAIAIARMELPEDTHVHDIADCVCIQVGLAVFERNEAYAVTAIATAVNA